MAESTYDELAEIPRGRGMLAGDIADRIGPALRAACGVAPADPPAIVRRKVANRLTELCEQLQADLRICVLAALALDPEADHPYMQDRMTWAAERINRDHPRAAVRRMKVGFRLLAEQLDEQLANPGPEEGWYTFSLRAFLRMDLDPPQLSEDRVIIASADGLEEIEIRLSAPANRLHEASPITATMLYGGEITRTERVTASHHKFVVRLPAPLRAGAEHEYGVRFTAFPRELMPRYYVLTPLQPCARCHVRVRFGTDVPARIWRVADIPPRAIDDFEPDDELLVPDRLGEVTLEFSGLHQGLSYGVRWSE